MIRSLLYTSLLVWWIVFIDIIQAADTDIVSHTVRRKQGLSDEEFQKKTVAYWTPERRKAAKPPKFPQKRYNQTKLSDKALQDLLKAADGPATVIEGQLPDKNLKEGQIVSATNQVTKTVGKVFFSTYYGDMMCSASVVTSTSKSLVVTAGHCIYDIDIQDWAINWIFVPAYDMFDAPLGEWTAKELFVLQGWSTGIYPDNFIYDVGFAVMFPLNLKRIAQVTGSQGIGFNLPKYQMTFSFGYPGDIGEGEIMSACIGKTIAPPCLVSGYNGQGLRCGMGGGSSGGPWIVNFVVSTGLGTIISLNSYGCPETYPYFMHGPYFTSIVQSAYNSVKSRI